MALTDSGCTVAWDLLVKRYNNPRLHFMHTMAALYGLESVPKKAAECIRHVLTLANVGISDLRRLKIDVDFCEHWLVHHLLTKLPSSTTQAWEHSLGSSIVIPTFSMLETFLLERLVSIDLIENRNQPLGTRSTPGQSSHPRAPNRSTFNSTNRHSFHVTTDMGARQCTLCQRDHVFRRCPSFLAKDCFARNTIAERIKACLNCLSTGHALSHCSSTRNCLQCGQRQLHFPNIAQHLTNSALSRQPTNGVHSAQGTQQSAASRSSVLSQQHSLAPGSTASNETQLLSAVATHRNPSTTILDTALIRIVSKQTGQSVLARALIDHGSEGTLIAESVVQTLGLSRTPISAEITGIGDSSHNRCRHRHLPKSDIDPRSFQHLQGLQFADPNFDRSGNIDVLVDQSHKTLFLEVTTSEDSHSQTNTNGKLGVFCSTIPHHAVLEEDSLTTKLRVVYDAPCKSSNGKPLNDVLCTGPALQNDLGGVILNWRCYRYVFMADIQRMYRCIEMHPEDSQFQRIWWRDKTGELKEFRLTTVTFGTASAPYTAIRVIHQIAQDERENYPLAEKVLKREIYVDDVQSGHETTDGAIRVRNDVIAALRSAGMYLRKWAASHPALLSDIPEVDLCNHSIFEMDNKDSIKTLGL
ncbi:uncharacterized protein [Drosophila takahashii]|uniref:uncharacterized protein n=1 Tax=Drosophila takahashii TaxID=29030 RepID=UPI003898E025